MDKVDALINKKDFAATCQLLGASAASLYVHNPSRLDSLQLVHTWGLRYPEPMVGLLLPDSSFRHLQDFGTDVEHFFPNVQSEPSLRDYCPECDDILYGDFVKREGVQSCARFRHRKNGKIVAALWINFRSPQTFADPHKKSLRDFAIEMFKLVGPLTRALTPQPWPERADMAYVLGSIGRLARAGQMLNPWLEELLTGLLKTFKIDKAAMAAVYRYKYKEKRLSLEARTGWNAVVPAATIELDKPMEAGIAGWAAIRRRGILVADASTSDYGTRLSHKILKPELKTVLAIPLLAGQRLFGVLEIQAPDRIKFSANDVRFIWFAAHQSAVAYSLNDRANMNQRLFDIARNLTVPPPSDKAHRAVSSETLKRLAELMCESLNAMDCDIWQWNKEKHEFDYTGATYENRPDDPPREHGWTTYIQKTRAPVLLSNIVAVNNFASRFWHAKEGTWKDAPITREPEPPSAVNKLAVKNQYAEVGVPFLLHESCLGVGWLKFRSTNFQAPSAETLKHITGFAAQAAQVIDHSERHADTATIQRTLRAISESLISPRPGTLLEKDWFECHVEQKVLDDRSKIGGDFHAVLSLPGNNRSGVLLGDGQGHGLSGALHMLAIISAFKTVCLESASTKHVLLKLEPICTELKVFGTATYFIIDGSDVIRENGERDPAALRLFVSSAGHPSLILLRDGMPQLLPSYYGIRTPLGSGTTGPLSEDVIPLQANDFIIGVTDGVLAILDPRPSEALRRLTGLVMMASSADLTSASTLARYISAQVLEMHVPDDDFTVLVVRILPIQQDSSPAPTAL